MARRFRFHPLVADDISAAIDWYEGRSVGLGERFRAVVDARFDDVIASSDIFPRAFGDADYRFARIPTFPYLVLFRAQSDAIDVVGLFHSATDPRKWRGRAGKW